MEEQRVTVAVIAGSEKTAKTIKDQLDTLFGRFITFVSFSTNEWMQSDGETDLALVSTNTLARLVAQKIKTGREIVVIRRTLLKHSWEKVLSIAPRKKLMLVNDERDSAVETIALLYELGARHIDLVPVYPGLADVPRLDTAITPGESHLVPKYVKEIVDIGDRVVDVSTMVDILFRFDLLTSETRSILAAYAELIIPRSHGLQVTMQGLSNMKNLLQKTLDIVQDGVIAYDDQRIITIFNRAAENILGYQAWEVVGQRIETLIKQEGMEALLGNEEVRDVLIHLGVTAKGHESYSRTGYQWRLKITRAADVAVVWNLLERHDWNPRKAPGRAYPSGNIDNKGFVRAWVELHGSADVARTGRTRTPTPRLRIYGSLPLLEEMNRVIAIETGLPPRKPQLVATGTGETWCLYYTGKSFRAVVDWLYAGVEMYNPVAREKFGEVFRQTRN